MGDLQGLSESKYTKLEKLEALRDQLRISTSPESQPVANAFRDNIIRVIDLGKLPGQTFYRGWYACELNAKRLAEESKTDWRNLNEHQVAIEKEELLGRIVKQWQDFYSLPTDLVKTRFPMEIEKYDNFQSSSELTAMFSAMIVGSWTAFNALASDLWITAFNNLPAKFKGLPGCTTRIHDQRNGTQNHSPATLPLSQAKIAWTGAELVIAGEVSFSGLRATRKSYSRLFSDTFQFPETEHVDSALADARLDAVSVTRNVLIHNAGIADGMYVKQSSGCPSLPALRAGDPLIIDGHITQEMVHVIVDLGSKLIKTIELWVQAAKSK
jgi:hypothetical protein